SCASIERLNSPVGRAVMDQRDAKGVPRHQRLHAIRPLDQTYSAAKEVVLVPKVIEFLDRPYAIRIEMVDREPTLVLVHDGKGGTVHLVHGVIQPGTDPLDQLRLPRPYLAVESDHHSGSHQLREITAELDRLLG